MEKTFKIPSDQQETILMGMSSIGNLWPQIELSKPKNQWQGVWDAFRKAGDNIRGVAYEFQTAV